MTFYATGCSSETYHMCNICAIVYFEGPANSSNIGSSHMTLTGLCIAVVSDGKCGAFVHLGGAFVCQVSVASVVNQFESVLSPC